MEASAATYEGARHDDEPENDVQYLSEGAAIEVPEAVELASKGQITPEVELDATDWLLSSDGPDEEDTEPTKLRLNVGRPGEPRFIDWFIVPLPDAEFRRFRKMAMGNRQQRRQVMQGDPTAVDDALFHRLVVTAATVKPNLREVATSKGVQDPAQVLAHRFAHKPGLIAQISGYVSDISGNDPDDVEIVAGNS